MNLWQYAPIPSIALMLLNMPLHADNLGGEKVRIKSGYNLRWAPTTRARVLKTTRKPDIFISIAKKGSWIEVCRENANGNCHPGTRAWVYHRAVLSSQKSNDNSNEGKLCMDCAANRSKRAGDKLAGLTDIARRVGPAFRLPSSFDNRCNTFISHDGLGAWGWEIVKAARKIAPNCFYNNNLFGRLCPNYRSLPDVKKDTVIAIAFAAIAQSESTCRPNISARGVNGTADGMFQLEREAYYRRQAGRDAEWCKSYQAVDTRAMSFQAECSVSIVKDTVCSWGSYIFDPQGYWEKLRNNREISRRIASTVRRSGLCQ